jgi:hypothetical protein
MLQDLARSVSQAFLVVFLAGACQSSGYERAGATADKATKYREDLVRLREEVALASEALRALSENPGDSPRSNQGTFQTFARELANLEASAKRSRKDYGRMDGRAEEFFGAWSADAARIANADLKHSAEQRRAALEANFVTLEKGQLEVDQALTQHVQALTDLRLYLGHDLTAAGIASARSTLTKVFAEGKALEERVAAQIRATDSAHESLEPLKDLAPLRSARAGGVR